MDLASQMKRTRRERGLTQAALAELLGCTQATISRIESHRIRPAPELEAKLRSLLGIDKVEHVTPGTIALNPPVADRLMTEGPDHILRRWQRPATGGDGVVSIPVGGWTLLAAIDVAGHGPAEHARLSYLQGWLRGWASALGTYPAVAGLEEALEAELEATGIEAAWFVGLLGGHGESQSGALQAAWSGYPPPVLIQGVPPRPLALENHGLAHLFNPWSLLIASDGLLQRLGGGEEVAGRRVLVRWFRGQDRERFPMHLLDVAEGPTDDELLVLVRSRRWSLALTVDVTYDADRWRAIDRVAEWSSSWLGEGRLDGVTRAVMEALVNVRDHAVVVEARIRAVANSPNVVVEVEDSGRGGWPLISGSGVGVMREVTDGVELRRGPEAGTIVALVFRR